MALLDLTLVLLSTRPLFFCFRSITVLKVMCAGVSSWFYACECRFPERSEEGVDLEVSVVMCCPKWVLGTELGSSTRVLLNVELSLHPLPLSVVLGQSQIC